MANHDPNTVQKRNSNGRFGNKLFPAEMRLEEELMEETPDDKAIAAIEVITPDIARALLGHNTHNRNVSKARVAQYAHDMRSNKWALNGEAIKIATSGSLLDGQHRLLACVEADTSFETWVMRGIARAAQRTMDSGLGRTVASKATLVGITNATAMTAAANWIWCIKFGHQPHDSRNSGSQQDIIDLVIKHSGLQESIILCREMPVVFVPPLSMAAAVHYVAGLAERAIADEFIRVLKSGIGSGENCPVLQWRELMVRARGDKKMAYTRSAIWRGTIHAWNILYRGQSVKVFRIPDAVKMSGVNLDLL